MKKYFIAFLAAVVVIGLGSALWQNQIADAPSHTNETAGQPTKSAAQATPTFDKTAYSLTDPASMWVIVNKRHPLSPKEYAPVDLTAVGNGQLMRAEAAQALTTMIGDAKAAGLTLTPASGYRSYSTQVNVYNNEVRAYGQATADSESARPGYSEHQTGWAIDLGSGGCNIQDCFGSTPGGKWAIANAYKYGFILRYPASLSDVTGYRNETWHFRYIGKDLALELYNQNIPTLEQFFAVSGGTTYN